MIKFTIEAANFIKAGEVEKLLRDAGIKYDTQLVNGHASRPSRKAHKMVTPEDVKSILGYLAANREESNTAVGARFGFGANTIWRIRNGNHPLCKKN